MENQSGEKNQILFVDDERSVTDALKRLLSDELAAPYT